MDRTPGFVTPLDFPDTESLMRKLNEQKVKSGFTTPREADIMHSAFDEVLEHFGIPGMRWGVRRSNPSAAGPASEDVAKARATAATIKAHGGKTDSISNADLNQLLDRMNLDQRYSKMLEDTSTRKQGQKKIKDLLETGKTLKDLDSFLGHPVKKAAVKGAAKAAKAGAKAAARASVGR
jgi:hypothetical protein